jgi:HPt (histidine-containing phosphotransfer) domain-containing protein
MLIAALMRYHPPERGSAQAQPSTPQDVVEAQPTLDYAAIEHLMSTLGDQDKTLVDTLIMTFIESADTLQTSARKALDQRDAPTLRRVMHTLKSNASTFGAKPLAALCRDLENRAASGNLEGAGASIDQVMTELARVKAALREL